MPLHRAGQHRPFHVRAAALEIGDGTGLAVIGFDDIEYGALTTPALTTVHVDAEAHGRQAARAVLGLEPGDLAHPPGYVIVRGSA